MAHQKTRNSLEGKAAPVDLIQADRNSNPNMICNTTVAFKTKINNSPGDLGPSLFVSVNKRTWLFGPYDCQGLVSSSFESRFEMISCQNNPETISGRLLAMIWIPDPENKR